MNPLALLLLAALPAAAAESHLTPPVPEPVPAEDPIASQLLGEPADAASAPEPEPAPAPKRIRPAAPKPAARKSPPELVVSSTPISIVFPPEGHKVDAKGQFLFGSVSHPLRPFRINGSTVAVHRKGGFLTYLPVQPGEFAFVCELDLPGGTTTLVRTVSTRQPHAALPVDSLAILPESLSPAEDVELRAGDWLTVRARGTPSLSGSFSLGAAKVEHPMPEVSPGFYEGAAQIRPGDQYSLAEILVTLRRDKRSVARALARGRLTVPQTPPEVAVVRAPTAYIRSGPERGFILFPAPGTRLVAAGKVEGWTKVLLSPGLSGWIDDKAIERLPPGTPPPAAVVGTIRTSAAPGATLVSIDLSQQVPYSVEESPELDRITVRLYYADGHTNWVIYDDADALLREVRWEQRGSNEVEVTAYLRPGRRLWGWDASFQNRGLRLELRHPPAIAARPASPLSGRVIVLDPGHMPSAPGALGPRRTSESEANFWLAKDLAALLQAEGAQVVLTRQAPADEASLGERVRLAWARRGDVFVSIHNNALPDGENPFERPHGYSVFYYHPHSLELARSVHGAYGRRVSIPSEGMRYGNLYVARASQMPAVLTESAYLMFPDQEDMLVDPARRKDLARAMADGLRAFLEAERSRQAPAAAPTGPPKPARRPSRAPKRAR